MELKITIHYKNKKTGIAFLIFFFNWAKKLKINLKIKKSAIKTIKKKVSILKSPHVHKKAQDQFEVVMYSKVIFVESTQILKVLTLLKNIKTKIFSDLKIKTEGNLIKNKLFSLIKQKNKKLNSYRIKNILHTTEFYGEYFLVGNM